MSIHASSSIILMPISATAPFWKHCKARCSWPITITCRLIKICCSHARCLKIRSFCAKWYKLPARIQPIRCHRKPPIIFAANAILTRPTGNQRRNSCGRNIKSAKEKCLCIAVCDGGFLQSIFTGTVHQKAQAFHHMFKIILHVGIQPIQQDADHRTFIVVN